VRRTSGNRPHFTRSAGEDALAGGKTNGSIAVCSGTVRRAAVLAVALVVASASASGAKRSEVDASVVFDVRLGLRRNQAGLVDLADALNRPGGTDFGQFLDLPGVASAFGAAPDDVVVVVRSLAAVGVDATLDPTGGMVEAPMTARQVAEYFSVKVQERSLHDGTRYATAVGSRTLPPAVQGRIEEVTGLSRGLDRVDVRSDPLTIPSDPGACAAAPAAVDDLRRRVGLDRVDGAPASGGAATIAVPAVDLFNRPALDAWSACVGSESPTVVETGSSYAIPNMQGHELELDLAVLSVAAQSGTRLAVVHFDPVGWVGEAYLEALADHAGPPAVISSSETYCEAALPRDDITLTEWVLAAAAAIGTSVVVSAGDDGSSGCAGSRSPGVVYPASSPFVTAVGGTQRGPGDVDTVWFDEAAHQATGGGESAVFPRPVWQAPPAESRRLPDVANLASPATWPAIPVCDARQATCSWKRLGGTSAAAPLFAGSVAILKGRLAADGRVAPGLWNPVVYGLAASGTVGAIHDVTTGVNDLDTLGCCQAGPGFDDTTGWGVVDVGVLASYTAAIAPPAR